MVVVCIIIEPCFWAIQMVHVGEVREEMMFVLCNLLEVGIPLLKHFQRNFFSFRLHEIFRSKACLSLLMYAILSEKFPSLVRLQ